ncbi:MAG TPA: hypothetical protein PLO52_04405 [Flavobacterium alvei]|nr:hypothetical protein [Flavobacterium alvei]HQK39342.1 hypothetical protein [Flavobacterium alvei]
MKHIILCSLVLISYSISTRAQDPFYKATSNLIVANEKKGTLDIGLNYEFQNIQTQVIYNFTDKYFAFGTYNINKSSYTYQTFIFGDTRAVENNNSGYSFGGGIQKLGRIGNYKNLELLIGFESQKVNNFEFSPNYNPEDKDHLIQNYYKLFTQFNMIKSKTNYDFGYSLKFSYLKFTHFEYNNGYYFNNKAVFFLDPTLSFNYKVLSNKNLLLTSQIGASLALNNIEYSYGDGGFTTFSTVYLLSPILKFGIQYRFDVK